MSAKAEPWRRCRGRDRRARPAAVQPRACEPGRGDIGRGDAAEREAGQGPRQLHLAQHAARRMAFAAMPQHVDQIAAALPRRPSFRLEAAGRLSLQEQQVPAQHSEADVVGEVELGPAVRHFHRPQLHQIGVDRVRIGPRHAAIGRVGHRRIELLAVAPRRRHAARARNPRRSSGRCHCRDRA